MTTTRRSTIRTNRGGVDRRAVAAAGVAMVLYALGWIGVAQGLAVVDGIVASAMAGWLAVRVVQRHRGECEQAGAIRLDEALVGVGLALVASRWVGGHVGGEAFALVLVVVAAVVVAGSRVTAAVVVAAVVVVEVTTHALGTAEATALGIEPVGSWAEVDWQLLGMRCGLVVGFALVGWLLVGRREARRRRAWQRQVDRQRRELLEEAREFRLIQAGRSESPVDREEARELIVRDAVDSVHHAMFVTLQLVKTALRAHTVVLLWFDVKNEKLRIKELISDSDDIVEHPIDPAGGVIGGISRRRDTVCLEQLRSDFRGLAYYRNCPGVTEFIGVPVIEQGHLRGVLCVDRSAQRAFGENEKAVVEDAAGYVMRQIENERMVTSMEKTRFEVSRFYEASRRLNEAMEPTQVYEVALESVRQIAAYDFAAITLYDDQNQRHRVVTADGPGASSEDDWEQVQFEPNQGLVSMVVRNRHYLPVGGQLRDEDCRVLTDRQDFSRLDSLVVLPLVAGDKPVGTMIVGHHRGGEFPARRREMLEVVANQVAITLQNARMYARMEAMAKYDALTGLANRRTFEEKLEETMARHKRAGRTFGLVLTDIDHFKQVNDTYGHPVGDEVLRRVGEVFDEQMRQIDVPARYGGEEFALILEDTDLEGAQQVAERLRAAIAALEFQTDQGLLQCTISLGVAIGPWDSDQPHELVDMADQALYHSKENGRNQVSIYREITSSGAAA